MKEHDSINFPAHYTASPACCSNCKTTIECIDVTRHHNFSIGNAIKYLWRAGLKGSKVEDLKKAIWYIQDEIKQQESKSSPIGEKHPYTIHHDQSPSIEKILMAACKGCNNKFPFCEESLRVVCPFCGLSYENHRN